MPAATGIANDGTQAYSTAFIWNSVSLTGGRGLAINSPFQRAWRDVHAAVQQMLMSWDMHGTNYGKVRLGHEFSDPRM